MADITWKLNGGRALGPAPFFIAGIVNVTPDSFYDGGLHASAGSAVEHAVRLAAQGADILDIGGESTRPYADPVSLEQEMERVVPVVRELSQMQMRGPDGEDVRPLISVDTYKAGVAAAALEAGAEIINDVSACAFDPQLVDVLGQYKPGYVLMHSLGRPETMQDEPHYDDVVDSIMLFFEQKLNVLQKAGLPAERVVLDPGIGFGKTLEHNFQILRNIERFMDFGLPVYMGLSNKSLWQGLLGLGPEDRCNATQVATALLAARGVAIHRVHEVALTRQSLTIVREMA